MAPKNKWELSDMMKFAVAFDGPIAIRYPRGHAYSGLEDHRAKVQLGKAEPIYEEKDIEIIAGQLVKLVHLLNDQAENGSVIGNEAKDELLICMVSIKDIYEHLVQNKNPEAEKIDDLFFMINSQTQINFEARENLMHRIKENQHSPFESIILLDALRSVDSLLGSMRYLSDHIRYKF